MMRRRLCSIGQTEIFIHAGCLLAAAYFMLLGYGQVFVVSMVSVAIHECGHAAIAVCFRKPPAEMELTPLGAVMRLDDDWLLPAWKQLLILLAGPATSLALGAACLQLTKHGLIGQSLGQLGFVCNLMLAVGNLLPALPLDGGRLLALLMNQYLPGQVVRRAMRCISTIIGLVCVLLNVFLSMRNGGWNFSCGMAGCFIMYAACQATATAAMAEMRMFIDRKHLLYRRGVIGCRWLAVANDTPLRRAVTRLRPGAYTMYAVVQPGSGKIMGWQGEDEVIAAYLNEPGGNVHFD